MLKKIKLVLLLLITTLSFSFNQSYSEENCLNWGVPEAVYNISTQLKQRIEFFLLQETVRYNLEKHLIEQEIPYQIFLENQIFPCQFSVFFDDKESKKTIELKLLLTKKDPSFLEESCVIKELWLNHFEKEKNLCSTLDRSSFLENSIKILNEYSLEDLEALFYNFKNLKFNHSPHLALTDENKLMITQLVDDLINKSINELIANRNNLITIKDQIEALPPMQLAEFLISQPDLKKKVKILLDSEGKSSFLLAFLELEINKLKKADLLNWGISEFVNFTNLEASIISHYIDEESYLELLDYLIQE